MFNKKAPPANSRGFFVDKRSIVEVQNRQPKTNNWYGLHNELNFIFYFVFDVN